MNDVWSDRMKRQWRRRWRCGGGGLNKSDNQATLGPGLSLVPFSRRRSIVSVPSTPTSQAVPSPVRVYPVVAHQRIYIGMYTCPHNPEGISQKLSSSGGDSAGGSFHAWDERGWRRVRNIDLPAFCNTLIKRPYCYYLRLIDFPSSRVAIAILSPRRRSCLQTNPTLGHIVYCARKGYIINNCWIMWPICIENSNRG